MALHKAKFVAMMKMVAWRVEKIFCWPSIVTICLNCTTGGASQALHDCPRDGIITGEGWRMFSPLLLDSVGRLAITTVFIRISLVGPVVERSLDWARWLVINWASLYSSTTAHVELLWKEHQFSGDVVYITYTIFHHCPDERFFDRTWRRGCSRQ